MFECCTLATILFEYLLLDPSAMGPQIIQRRLKNSLWARHPCSLLFAPTGPPSGETLIQKYFKRH